MFEVQYQKLYFLGTPLLWIFQDQVFYIDKAFGDVAVKEVFVFLLLSLAVYNLSLIVLKQKITQLGPLCGLFCSLALRDCPHPCFVVLVYDTLASGVDPLLLQRVL